MFLMARPLVNVSAESGTAATAAEAHCGRGAMPMMAEPRALVDGRGEKDQTFLYIRSTRELWVLRCCRRVV
jgi:hypothetical protein